jgi:SAM-dependent methyltransferase
MPERSVMSREPIEKLIARYFPEGCCAGITFFREIETRMPGAGAVLDLGCGDNRMLAPYRTPARQIWGADLQIHPRIHDRDWFCLLPPRGRVPFPDESFDLIASCWVLEHVREPGLFLAEVFRLLRPGGAFVSMSINAWHYVTWLARLLGMLPHRVTQALVRRLYGRESHDTFPAWYRMNTSADLRRQAKRIGLEVCALHRHVSFGYFAFSAAMHRAAVHLDHLLDRITPELGRLYFVVTLRKPDAATKSALPPRRAA